MAIAKFRDNSGPVCKRPAQVNGGEINIQFLEILAKRAMMVEPAKALRMQVSAAADDVERGTVED